MKKRGLDYIDGITNPKTGEYTLWHKFQEWLYINKNILSILAVIFGIIVVTGFVSRALKLSSDASALLLFFSALGAILVACAIVKNSGHYAYPVPSNQKKMSADIHLNKYKDVDNLTQEDVNDRFKKYREKHRKQ